MKINKVTIKNINSLKGEFEINFKEFEEEGLFAITGATGSGKTTILDAITLALFGRTPRIKKSTEELMSKHTGECFSECEFEINGKVYISRFSQKRARSKPEGNIQTPKMTLFTENGEILETKVSAVPKKVEKLTGLDFNRFTRSILLAQGGFDAFLKASVNEKAELLEKITSSKIYAQISTKVFEKTKEIENETLFLKREIENIEILREDEIQKYHLSIEENKKEYEHLQKRKNSVQEKYQNLKRAKETEKLLYKEENYKKSLLEKKEKFKEQFSLLQKALLAREIKRDFERYEEVKENISSLNFSSKKLEEDIKNIKDRLSFYLAVSKEELSKDEKSIKKTKKLLNEDEERIKKLKKEYSQKELQELFSKKENIVKEGEYLKNIQEKLKKINFLSESKKKARQKIKALLQKNEELSKLIKEEEKEIFYLKEIIKRLEKQKELESKILNYEKDREKLKKGEPCPLCGSLTHPYAQKNDFINFSETEKELEKSKEKLTKKEKKIEEYKIESAKIKNEISHIEETLSTFEKEEEEIKKYEITFKTHKEAEKRLEFLREEYKKTQKEINSLKEKEETIGKLKDKIFKYKNALSSLESKRNQINSIINNLNEKISPMFSKLPENKKEFKFQSFQELINALIDSDRELASKKKLLEENLKREEQEKKRERVLKEKFLNALKEKGFLNEEEFKSSLLTKERIQHLYEMKDEIEKNLKESEISVNHLKKELQPFKGQNIEKNLKESEEELLNIEKDMEILNEERIKLKSILKENEKNMKKREKLLEKYEKAFETFKLYSHLNTLIGTKDGSKFRKFAQNITLEYLIELANIHLQKLNDRYLLQKSDSQELSFEIIDTYQADSKRTVDTLSGGESFIVSLSLALGLCDMVSKKVKINTLFLDEGFGTLDTETLESVLSALNSIKSEGKTIGIISHVESLKERIQRKIKVVKLSGGVSKIEIV